MGAESSVARSTESREQLVHTHTENSDAADSDQEGGGSSLKMRTQERIAELAKIKTAETLQRDVTYSAIELAKANQQLLKKIFKKLDPTITNSSSNIQGEIQVSLKWDVKRGQLLVKVIRCQDLGPSGKAASPFVSISIFPDRDSIGSKQTSISHKSQNPIFNEIFSFAVAEEHLEATKLILRVIDYDVIDEDELMGEVIINLSSLDFATSPVHTAWYSLEPEVNLGITGELDVSLTYTFPQTLGVHVHGASGLKKYDMDSTSDPYVKVIIPGFQQGHVSQVVVGSRNPRWNESFTFVLPREELNFRYIVLTVLDAGAEEGHDLLGHAILDLDNLDPDSGFHGSLPLLDMSQSEKLTNKWFQTATAQEFREALWAHSFFQQPGCLFHKHRGNKIVRLSCARSGAKAKLHLRNGMPIL